MPSKNKIHSKTSLLEQVNKWKSAGEKIVFTNGCFDILHLGHIDYLERAAELGTKLVVALNTDRSVQQLKGPLRPVNDEYSRLRMMAAFEFTDAVVLFDEPTPLELIETVAPDVLVKGEDYAIDEIVGAQFVLTNGGVVQPLAFVQGYSTTSIINKIKNMD